MAKKKKPWNFNPFVPKTDQSQISVMAALRELGNGVGAAEDKLVYQLSVDEGNRRREGDNSWCFER